MFKKISVLLLVLLLLTATLLLVSCNENSDGTESEKADPLATPEPSLSFELLENGTWSVSKGDFGYKKEIVIPAEHEGRAVTEIAENGFAGAIAKTIVLPDSIRAIGAAAFRNCSNLTSLTLPAQVTEIPTEAFKGCIAMQSFTFPTATVTIGAEAFKECTALTEITIPEGVTAIGDAAFYGCPLITSITLPSTLQSVGTEAFATTGENVPEEPPYTLEYKIIDGDLYLGNQQNPRLVLIQCRSADTTYTLHADTRIIYDSAFYGLPLQSIVLHENVTDIGASAFAYCTALSEFYVPAKVKSICTRTFYYCQNLQTVTGLAGVESVGDSAFAYCKKLTDITFGNNVSAFGQNVFLRTDALKTTTHQNISYIGSTDNPYLLLYRVIDKTEDAYALHPDTKIIYPSAFSNCKYVENINLPHGVTRIGYSAFSGCSNLLAITIPDTVTAIADRAFYRCTRFYTAVVPKSVTYIGLGAFEGCSGMTSITLPFVGQTATGAGNKFFGHVFGATNTGQHLDKLPTGLKTVTITGGTVIQSAAFSYCKSLENIKLPASLKVIGDSAFFLDKNIKQVYITDLAAWCNVQMTSTDSNPLSFGATLIVNGKKVTNLVIPESVTEIAPRVFNGCKSITSLTMSDNVTKIGDGAFENCISLKEAEMGDGVTVVRSAAFYGCEALESIRISGTLTEIGNSAFRNCKALTELKLPRTLTRIDDRAFKGCDSLSKVRFAGILGWHVSNAPGEKGEFVLPLGSAKNATKLTEDYVNGYWKRG